MNKDWDGRSILHFHVVNGRSTYVSVDERSSSVFTQALDEYMPLMNQYWILHNRDSEISMRAHNECIPTSFGNGGKYTYQKILSDEKASTELKEMVREIMDLWYWLRENIEGGFCPTYLMTIPAESLVGPFLTTNGNEDALWCANHLMSVYNTVSELQRQFSIEEESTKAANYSIKGFWIGICGLIVGAISLLLTLYCNM